ncbi:MAG: hypothetical protein AB7P21_07070 [Lautropia sp.]
MKQFKLNEADQARFDIQHAVDDGMRFIKVLRGLRRQWHGSPAGRVEAMEFVGRIRALGPEAAECADAVATYLDQPPGPYKAH